MRLPQSVPRAETLPALTLAYVGDAVYELYVRSRLLSCSHNAHTLNRLGVARVNHHAQAKIYDQLQPQLEGLEPGVVRRGRNAKGIPPRNANPSEYRKATALEALVGYLYLSGQEERLAWVLSLVDMEEKGGAE